MSLPPLRERREPRFGAALLCAFGAAVLGLFAFIRGERVPLLGYADLGFHELGHLLFQPAPDLVTALMGNGLQTLVPIVLVGYFLWQLNWPAAGLCLAWAATTLQDASVYIADAPYQALPLLYPGGTHDWAFVLAEIGTLERAASIASATRDAGFALWLLAFAVCLGPSWWRWARRAPSAPAPTPETP